MSWAADLEVTSIRPGVARVAGWALPPDGPIGRVEILGDDALIGRAIVGAYRKGVAEQSDRADAPISGFARTVLTGAATTVAARVVSAEGSVTVLDPQPVTPAVPAPAPVPVARPQRASRPPLRVAAYGEYARPGGAQRVLGDLLQGLRAHATECRLLTPTPDAAAPAIAAAPVEVVPKPPLSDPAGFERWIALMADRLAGSSAVVVDTFGAFAGVVAAARAGVPAVWAVHESVPPAVWIADEAARRNIHPDVAVHFERALQSADALVFVSERARAAFAADRPGPVTIALPYGIDTGAASRPTAARDRAALRREQGYGPEDRVVACLSMIGFGKGQARLAQAFDRVADRFPEARLVMVGDRGLRYADGIREFIARSGRADRIRVLPVTDDVMSWHRLSDAVVLASSVEMLPRVMIEAMTTGRPVAATDVFGAGEHIVDGETGYLCEPDDLGALTGMLDRVLAADREEWDRITAAALPLVAARLDPGRWIEGWIGLLRSVAGVAAV